MDDPQAFIRTHMEFHALVVELAGNQTLAVLNGMVRHIIEQANWSHVDLDAGSPENVRANKRGFRAHVRLVELVAAQEADEAEALWRLHLAEAENYLLMNNGDGTFTDRAAREGVEPPADKFFLEPSIRNALVDMLGGDTRTALWVMLYFNRRYGIETTEAMHESMYGKRNDEIVRKVPAHG